MFLADLRGKDTHKVEKENLLEREPSSALLFVRMVIICYANRMKSEQILMKSIQIILTSFLNQFGLC